MACACQKIQHDKVGAKFCTFKQLFCLNQVTNILAVPAGILRIFSVQNLTPLRRFGTKN
jgi:hypothetical protein